MRSSNSSGSPINGFGHMSLDLRARRWTLEGPLEEGFSDISQG
jgi:hypothetical protein